MTKITGVLPFALAGAAVLIAVDARADAAGDKVLAAVDAAMNRARTHIIEYEVTNTEPGKPERKLAYILRIKGEKRLIEFVAPADMKGTKVLILSPTQMYVYLPAFGKVRRIASHTSDQGFLGLAYSQDDFALQAFSPQYTARVTAEDTASWQLTAIPKAGQTAPFARLDMTVKKDKSQIGELRFFNGEGKLVRTETRAAYGCEGDVCTPAELKMVDHTKGGFSTKLVRKSWKVNAEISDDTFSQRSLEK